MKCFVKPMNKIYAEEICKWNYEQPYNVYNMGDSDENLEELLNGYYYAALDEDGKLIGFFCFGQSAQVPAGNEVGAYLDNSYLDIGLGMKPDICGQGAGRDFLKKGLQFAAETFLKKNFRLTVAAFNERAMKVYEGIGFKREIVFQRKNGENYTEFMTMSLTID